MDKKRSKEKIPPPKKRALARQPTSGKPLTRREAVAFLTDTASLMRRRPPMRLEDVPPDADLAPKVLAYESEAPQAAVRRLRASLDGLQNWRKKGLSRLEDLLAKRRGKGVGARPLPATAAPRAQKIAHRLIVSLAKNALAVSTLEGMRGRWHLAAKEAREAVRLRKDVAIKALGRSLRPLAQAHLKLAYATYMLEGNSPKLRSELREAVKIVPKSQALAYWLSRYEVMAGNYKEAHRVAQPIFSYSQAKMIIQPIVDGSRDYSPWDTYPCNFYTYRYSLINDETIGSLKLAFEKAAENSQRKLGNHVLGCWRLWNQANRDMTHGKYSSALQNYSDCQRAILAYFAARYSGYAVPTSENGVYSELVRVTRTLLNYSKTDFAAIWNYFRQRYMMLTLKELYKHDWERTKVAPSGYRFYLGEPHVFVNFTKSWPDGVEQKVQEKIEAPLLSMGLIFAPLAKAEAHRMRRDFDPALRECRQMLRRHDDFKILCQHIEVPFIKLLTGHILLEKGDAEYRTRATSKSSLAQKYQCLAASETYFGVLQHFWDQGQYVNLVEDGLKEFQNRAKVLLDTASTTFHPYMSKIAGTGNVPALITETRRRQFEVLGHEITIPTISLRVPSLPGQRPNIGPHEPLLKFQPPAGETTLRERNPLVYTLVIQARARLLQMESGLNYLGYSDSYVPPWRFQFLLSRARYFAEHAKGMQAEFLNFLANAEREEFQEQSASHNVTLEKMNLLTEEARVEHSRLQVVAAKISFELAQLTENNAQARLDGYERFDEVADFLDEMSSSALFRSTIGSALGGAFSGAATGVAIGATIGAFAGPAGVVAGALIGGIIGLAVGSAQSEIQGAQIGIAAGQRDFEKSNLDRATQEAAKAREVSQNQLTVAQAGLEVAAVQKFAAMVRHDFANESLRFLRNRALGSEMWFRLAAGIRAVADTYMRYAVELSFLAEQAYEFEADKRVNVIRFDYDFNEVGSLLAADFLLADLDTLEHNLITTHQTRQQQVRYVVSMVREYPAALQELRETGSVIISVRLEQLERRFPGLYNLRIGSVEVLPVALMDPTRFSLELTHMGTSQVRFKGSAVPISGQGDGIENETDVTSWLPDIDSQFRVRVRASGPETSVYSGMSRPDRESVFSFMVANQRGAFEHMGAAASWRIDMSMKENKVVPGTLADLLITFNLSGYFDPVLKTAVESAATGPSVLTQFLSGSQVFPDAFYDFNRTAAMTWPVTAPLLSLNQNPSNLRNAAFLLFPKTKGSQFTRLMAAYAVEFKIDSQGALEIVSPIPKITFTAHGLVLTARAELASATLSWDFGDRTSMETGAEKAHTYARPGKYTVVLRAVHNNRLFEYRADVSISSQHVLKMPLTVYPDLAAIAVVGGRTTIQGTMGGGAGTDPVTAVWKVLGRDANYTGAFELERGKSHVLVFTAIRDLKAKIYSFQRAATTQLLILKALRITTNRVFDPATNQPAPNQPTPTALTTYLFATGPLSPVDRWTLELPLLDNPSLQSVTPQDELQVDLSDLGDTVLALEYETTAE